MSGWEVLLTPENIATFLTLTFLEIVLAGDNLVLIAILSGKLPAEQRPFARRLGIVAAVVTRILLLFSLFWLSHLERPIADGITPRQIVFTVGGAFLIWKSLTELGTTFLFGDELQVSNRLRPVQGALLWTVLQIAFFDIIFSLDSVIAAIGIAKHVEIMVAAVLTATFVMIFLVNPIANFIDRNQIVKVAALDLLFVIGLFLVGEAFHQPIPKAELYTAFAGILILQAVILWLFALHPAMRRILVIGTTLALAVGAVALISDETLARNVHDTLLGAWHNATRFVDEVIDRVGSMVPKH